MQFGVVQGTVLGMFCAIWWAPAMGQTIYSCVDAKGRRLTADRPIAECMDREQRELNPSGTVRRKIGPALTASERATEEEKARKAGEEKSRADDDKRRDRALISRYPNKAVHDKERGAALRVVDEVTGTAAKRVTELAQHRKDMDKEFELYKADPSKVPPRLKREMEDNQRMQGEQKRFIAEQGGEKQRVNSRFDEELARLSQLWAAK